MNSSVTPLHVADEAFLVESTFERCPKNMMIRELLVNAVEAALLVPEGARVELGVVEIEGTPKLFIRNTGPGMTAEELLAITNLSSSLRKQKGLDGNFGMGGKVASLPSNKHGLRYRSCRAGVVSEVILCQRAGVYGRLRRAEGDVVDVTSEAARVHDLSHDWTEVVLMGDHAGQNTAQNPYNGNPGVGPYWLANSIYLRFFRFPDSVEILFLPGLMGLGEPFRFRTIPARAYPLGRAESVTTASGVVIHYFYDPLDAATNQNTSARGSLATGSGFCALVYKNEFYEVSADHVWAIDSPIFGVNFASRQVSIHIELPDDFPCRPEIYRNFLRYREGAQQPVRPRDFCDLARANRPQWFIDVVNAFLASDRGRIDEIRKELQQLLDFLRVPAGDASPSPFESFDKVFDQPSASAQDQGGPQGQSSPPAANDAEASPRAAPPQTGGGAVLQVERAPEIILLHDQAQIVDKRLGGKAAKFYPESRQLFVNMAYPSVEAMRRRLELEFASVADVDAMRSTALDFAERTLVVQVGRAAIFALSKTPNSDWSRDDIQRALSPEALSIAADDYFAALAPARARMARKFVCERPVAAPA